MFGKEKEKYPQNRWFNWQDVIKKLKSVSNGSLSDNFLEYPIGKQFVMTTCKWGGARTECRLDLPKLQGGKSARSSEKGTRCIYDDAAGPLFFCAEPAPRSSWTAYKILRRFAPQDDRAWSVPSILAFPPRGKVSRSDGRGALAFLLCHPELVVARLYCQHFTNGKILDL